MMLCHEHDEDPKMRPEPITPEKREDIIMHMAAGLVGAYRYFRAHQETYAGSASAPQSGRTTSKVGRNRTVSLRFGKEIQEVLRRGDRELALGSDHADANRLALAFCILLPRLLRLSFRLEGL